MVSHFYTHHLLLSLVIRMRIGHVALSHDDLYIVILFLGGNIVSWSAKKQPIVSRSSCESEYQTLANTTTEIIWITHLL